MTSAIAVASPGAGGAAWGYRRVSAAGFNDLRSHWRTRSIGGMGRENQVSPACASRTACYNTPNGSDRQGDEAMTKFKNYVPAGVIPACILPFHDDLSLDLKSFAKHLNDTAGVDGLSAITVNAHSTEVGSCTVDEQRGAERRRSPPTRERHSTEE